MGSDRVLEAIAQRLSVSDRVKHPAGSRQAPYLIAPSTLLIPIFMFLAQIVSAGPVPSARAAVERAIPMLERSAKSFVGQRSCVSFHHNIPPILALRLAASRGFVVDATTLGDIERKTFRELTTARAFDDAVQGLAT